MPTKVTIAYLDHSGERTSWSCEGVDLSSANYDAQDTLIGNMRTAAAALLNGTLNRTTISTIDDGSSALPSDPAAQRELKIRLTYADNVNGRLFNTHLPCPDMSHASRAQGTDVYNIEETEFAAFVTAFEAYARAPGTGNAVTVQSARLVGRRV